MRRPPRELHSGNRRERKASRPAAGLRPVDCDYPGMPSNDEIFGWVSELWRFGNRSKYGHRMPGTAADHQAARYVEARFREFGLEDVKAEPMSIFTSFPDRWALHIESDARTEEIPCYFLRYAAFTPQQGISADLVYLGTGSEEEFKAKAAAGKIAMVDLIAPPGYYSDQTTSILFVYDPGGTLLAERGSQGFPIANLSTSIDLARRHGAIGYIGILTFRARDNCQEYHGPKYGNQVIPALTISPASGDRLKTLLAAGPLRATIVLTEAMDSGANPSFGSWGVTYNLYGTIPGTSAGAVVLMSHHDGGATNEASGVSTLMALAKYFSGLPKRSRKKSLLFFVRGSHFGWRPPLLDGCKGIAAVKDSVTCVMNVEMIGRQMALVDGEYVATELSAPARFGISGACSTLAPIVQAAIQKHGLDRTIIGTRLDGEGVEMKMAGLSPVIERISLNATQFSDADTPDTVMKEALRPTACAFADIISAVDALTPSQLKAN
ncbi:MAG: M28 family peptidase [Candidatus Binataceae bacterium]